MLQVQKAATQGLPIAAKFVRPWQVAAQIHPVINQAPPRSNLQVSRRGCYPPETYSHLKHCGFSCLHHKHVEAAECSLVHQAEQGIDYPSQDLNRCNSQSIAGDAVERFAFSRYTMLAAPHS